MAVHVQWRRRASVLFLSCGFVMNVETMEDVFFFLSES